MCGDQRQILRFLTAGSVDDGKSTLIGRLLHDANAIYQDQMEAVRAASASSGGNRVDFALVTDGLRAEREQGITIDVAYRYFATSRRKFIVADSPGHEQYTRNMATGASTASLAVLLVDAKKGLLPQTHRHAIIAWLLGIRDFAIVVNKMDLADFREDVFRRVEAAFSDFVGRLGRPSLQFVPCCSPSGDNVVRRSERMPWYTGPTLLEFLETTPIASSHYSDALRCPIQSVLRCNSGERCYAGRIVSGVLRTGDVVRLLPSRVETRVKAIHVGDRVVDRAASPLSVAIMLADDVDLGRGDMLVGGSRLPAASRRFAATLLWMANQPLAVGQPYLIKHTSRYVCGSVIRIEGVIDPVTLARRPVGSLALNEFAEVEIETHQPLYTDVYSENHDTGSFIMIEATSNETVAAGMISGHLTDAAGERTPTQNGRGMTIWFTGLSSAGKSTISRSVYEKLWAKGYRVELLDGDLVRQHLSKDLSFSKVDRDENIRRIGFIAELLTRNGVIALVAAISPYRAVREEIRERIDNFLEVYVNAPLAVVEERDVKGIYHRCRLGELRGVTGIDDPYEPPLASEVECRTDVETLAESVAKVLRAVEPRIGRLP